MIDLRALWTLALGGLALAGLGTVACNDVPAQCTALCSQLSDCGMLPGPLGDDQPRRDALADCEARCTVSPSRDSLSICFDTIGRPDAESDPWCKQGTCYEAASCLRSALGSDFALGNGSVLVSGVNQAPSDATRRCPVVPTIEQGQQQFLMDICKPPDPQDPTNDSVLEFDGGLSLSPGDVILELVSDELPTMTVLEGTCEGLQGHPHVPNVPVGTYYTELRMYDRLDNDCVRFDGDLFTVTAESMVDVTFWIEYGPGVKADLCPEAEDYRCRDGEDNDGDGRIDCEDMDCEGSGVCDTMSQESGDDGPTRGSSDGGTG